MSETRGTETGRLQEGCVPPGLPVSVEQRGAVPPKLPVQQTSGRSSSPPPPPPQPKKT